MSIRWQCEAQRGWDARHVLLKLVFSYNYSNIWIKKVYSISSVLSQKLGWCYYSCQCVQQAAPMGNKLHYVEAYLSSLPKWNASHMKGTKDSKLSVSPLASPYQHLCRLMQRHMQWFWLFNCLAKTDHGIHWSILFMLDMFPWFTDLPNRTKVWNWEVFFYDDQSPFCGTTGSTVWSLDDSAHEFLACMQWFW